MVTSWISVQVATTSPGQAFPQRGLPITLASMGAMKPEGGPVAQPPLWVFWPLCISQCLLLPALAVANWQRLLEGPRTVASTGCSPCSQRRAMASPPPCSHHTEGALSHHYSSGTSS